MLIAIAALILIGVTFGVMSMVMEARSKSKAASVAMVTPVDEEEDLPQALQGSFRERLIAPLIERLSTIAGRVTPQETRRSMAQRLERAGYPWGVDSNIWVVVRVLSALAAIGAAIAAVRLLPLNGMVRLLVFCVTGAAGLIGPGYVLDMKIKQRQAQIRRALPEIIDLLLVSVQSGLGLDAAVQEVVKRRHGPLLEELARVLSEIGVGKSRRLAWQEMADRTDLRELRAFVAALVQAEELGSSIAGVMRSQADALRTQRSLHIRELAAVLPVKMLFPLVFFIFPSIFVVILGPGGIKIYETFKEVGF